MRTASPPRVPTFVCVCVCVCFSAVFAVTTVLASLAAFAGIAIYPTTAHAAPDAREMRAREDFAAGRYQEALDIFAKLYAEKLHPNYLRNIGRCYQNLGQADRAISSFREYLRKAKKMTDAERVEIDGYIAEMEQLKKAQEGAQDQNKDRGTASARIAPPAGGSAPAAPALVPAASGAAPRTVLVERDLSPANAAAPPPVVQINVQQRASTSPAPDEDASPVYARWWFWAIVGGVVVAGVGGAAAAGVFTVKNDAPCSTGNCK